MGCDAYGQFVLENQSGRQVTVRLPGGDVVLAPCSVHGLGMVYPPPQGRVELQVVDESGTPIPYEQELIDRAGGAGRTLVRIGCEACGCQQEAQQYNLVVWSENPESLEAYLEERLLGEVGPRASASFGPLPGSWRDLAGVRIRKRSGREASVLDLGLHFDYILGQVPDINVGVTSIW